MKEIEKILEDFANKDIDIPDKIRYRIQYTLKNKEVSKNKIKLKKLVTVLSTVIITCVSGISVYAAFGGTISGKPVTEWLGIKFSNEYNEYQTTVEQQEVTYNNTSIDLVSTICDDGFTILEFDVKLSPEDREYLRLDKNIISEEEINKAEGIEKEFLQQSKDVKNTIHLTFAQNNLENVDKSLTSLSNNFNIIIDNEEYWLRSRATQTVEKISDYEYKVYQLYFLSDKELNGKTEFTITLNNVILSNMADNIEYNNRKITNTANNLKYIKMEGNYTIPVSKTKTMKNTEVVIPEDYNKAVYNNITKKVEKVTITPLQFIAKITTEITNVSLKNLEDTESLNYIGLSDYKIYDDNDRKLISHNYEVERVIEYSNGEIEEWEIGDIQSDKEFENAILKLTEYVVIEKNDTEMLKILPIIQQTNKEINLDIINVKVNN